LQLHKRVFVISKQANKSFKKPSQSQAETPPLSAKENNIFKIKEYILEKLMKIEAIQNLSKEKIDSIIQKKSKKILENKGKKTSLRPDCVEKKIIRMLWIVPIEYCKSQLKSNYISIKAWLSSLIRKDKIGTFYADKSNIIFDVILTKNLEKGLTDQLLSDVALFFYYSFGLKKLEDYWDKQKSLKWVNEQIVELIEKIVRRVREFKGGNRRTKEIKIETVKQRENVWKNVWMIQISKIEIFNKENSKNRDAQNQSE